jgi:guanosine-3',5'-bis(diphosphate) 3'-pyrophosphohydrolase
MPKMIEDAIKDHTGDMFVVLKRQKEKEKVERMPVEVFREELRKGSFKLDEIVRLEKIKGSPLTKVMYNKPEITGKTYFRSVTNYTSKSNVLKNGVFNLSDMEELVKTPGKETSNLAVSMFLHFLEIEKQLKGLAALKRSSKPDTQTFKSPQEILYRDINIDLLSENSKIDSNLMSSLQNDSVLSSLFDKKIIMSMLNPLFKLRDNKELNDFILSKIRLNADVITANFGKGKDGVSRFIDEYKNGMINFIYQNYMSNLIDSNGKITNTPSDYRGHKIVINNSQEKDVVVNKNPEGEITGISINQNLIDSDYDNNLYLGKNNALDNSYFKRGLKTFRESDQLFPDKTSYLKFVLEREYLRAIYASPRAEFNENMDNLISKALEFAAMKHEGQTRAGGKPYVLHPVSVANSVLAFKKSKNLDALINAALLHDTVEDTETTYEELERLFGGLTASLVKELTTDKEKADEIGKDKYLAQKMAGMSSYALVIKLADRLDNVQDIATAKTPEWRARYKKETEDILNYIERNRVLSGTHKKIMTKIRAKLDQVIPSQETPEKTFIEFENFISDRALMNTFNRAVIMQDNEHSYTDKVMGIIKNFPTLKNQFPILEQISRVPSKKGDNIITLNDRRIISGAEAEIYVQNIKQLADPNIRKVDDPLTNKAISEVFSLFPQMMVYQHGVGVSKYGFNMALPVDKYNTIMKYASKIFSTNYMNEKTFNVIFDRLTAVKTPFKSYMIDATKFEEFTSVQPIEETEEELLESDPEEEQLKTPTQPSTSVEPGVEISSNAKGLAAALTNPTELAKSKGNLTQSYPVEFRGKTYKDAEAAYQALKSTATKDDGPNSTYNLMVDIIKAKLEQYPRLVSEITKQGGSAWILSSTHQPTKQNSVWETGGKNWFIKALNDAYVVTTQPSTQPAEPTILPGFQGYKGGFENTGKGTPKGDGKDKAMREIADGGIFEVASNKPSSTVTSAKEIGILDQKGKTVLSQKNIAIAPTVVMLARNGALKGQPLEETTKNTIDDRFSEGAEFVVGDMPGVDSQFIDYLQEIGAKFTIYHTGTTPRIQVTQASTQPTEVKIEPTDKVIWGHPTIGKSFLKKNQDNRFISLDDDYASEINTKVKEIADKYNVTTYQVKDGGNQQWNTEYNKMMQNLFDKAKTIALSENKILFTSNTNLLKNNADVFDKVINLTNEEFQKRISERGAKYDTVTWKKQIEDVISNIPSNKVILTDKYLSDLLSTQLSTSVKPKASRFEGLMTYPYRNNKRADVVSETTFDAVVNGERTATTRYESQGNMDYWKQAKVGDIITFKDKTFSNTVDVVVTKEFQPLKGSGKTPEQWSKLEGWNIDYFNRNVRPKLDEAWQIEFKLVTEPIAAQETETNLPPAGTQLNMFDNFDESSEQLRKQQEEDERREDEEDNNCTDSPFLD